MILIDHANLIGLIDASSFTCSCPNVQRPTTTTTIIPSSPMSDPFPTNSPTYLALTTDLRELLLLLTSPLPDLSSHLLPLPLHQQLTASLNPTTQSDLTQELSPVSSSAPSSNSSVSSSETDINAGTRTSGAAGSVIHDTNDGPSFGGIDEEDPDVHEHCGADDRKREKGPSIIAHTSSPVSTPTPASIPSSPPPAGSIPYPLLRQIGLFCTSPEGRDLLSAHSIGSFPLISRWISIGRHRGSLT